MRTGALLLGLTVVCALAACGSRTGLVFPIEDELEPGPDATPDVSEPDVAPPLPDASPDVDDVTVLDVREEPDAHEKDSLPPIDVSPPVDVVSDCPDAGSTYIYVITLANELMSFYPPTATFRSIGTIACPAGGSTPFSMAVDATGVAYVEFSPSGDLFQVSTLTAACARSKYQPGQNANFTTFGMGFTSNTPEPGETLFVGSDGTPSRLGAIDPKTFVLTAVGAFSPSISEPELTGTGAGDLFAFYGTGGGASSAIGQIDKATAAVVAETPLPGVAQGNGWAFGFWGGDFYTFTAPSGGTVVTRLRPSDGSIVQVAHLDQVVVGAGVSTCAPQR